MFKLQTGMGMGECDSQPTATMAGEGFPTNSNTLSHGSFRFSTFYIETCLIYQYRGLYQIYLLANFVYCPVNSMSNSLFDSSGGIQLNPNKNVIPFHLHCHYTEFPRRNLWVEGSPNPKFLLWQSWGKAAVPVGPLWSRWVEKEETLSSFFQKSFTSAVTAGGHLVQSLLMVI